MLERVPKPELVVVFEEELALLRIIELVALFRLVLGPIELTLKGEVADTSLDLVVIPVEFTRPDDVEPLVVKFVTVLLIGPVETESPALVEDATLELLAVGYPVPVPKDVEFIPLVGNVLPLEEEFSDTPELTIDELTLPVEGLEVKLKFALLTVAGLEEVIALPLVEGRTESVEPALEAVDVRFALPLKDPPLVMLKLGCVAEV